MRNNMGCPRLPATFVLVALLGLLTAFKAPPVPPVSFSFSLASSLKTSAGVYSTDGVLVRTLWSGVVYPAGTHNGVWDGTTDDGQLASNGTYHIKVMSNNVKYVWEGTVGNNSDADTGKTVQRGIERINGMATYGQYAYYSKGYAEGGPSGLKMKLDTPGKRIQILPAGNTDQQTMFVCTDGIKVYWGGFDPYGDGQNFVFATAVSNDAEVSFPGYGKSIKMVRGKTYIGALDSVKHDSAAITGLAVQRSGNYLFVAHERMNRLHVLNKTTGQLVQTLSYTKPRALAVDTAGFLWMVYQSGSTVRTEKFTVAANGTLSTAGVVLSGLAYPLAMAVSPNNQTVVVVDGGTSQQLKAYSNGTGSSSWTYGQAGGYAVSATVANNKFYLSDLRDTMTSFIAFQPDGSFWVGDPGNNRAQHFSASRSFINNIMYVPGFFGCFLDPNNNTRVFADYLEYQIDYSKPLGHNNGSWTLVKNWGSKVPANKDNEYQRMRNVTTLSNGRTYALFLITASQKWEVAELTPADTLRFTTKLINVATDSTFAQLYPDGSIRRIKRRYLNVPIKWIKQPLTGFDANHNPLWGSDSLLASTPPVTNRDPGFNGNATKLRSGEMTSSNLLIAFDPGAYAAGFDNYHIGAVKYGDNKWLWRTAPSTFRDYTGDFPADGTYDIGNSVVNAGVPAMAVDRHIFWGYHGEFWKNSQTNKWNHLYDNGLLVNQFGITGPEVAGREAAPQMSANAFSPVMTKRNDTIFIYQNDEGLHSGIHRWRITGLNTIQEQIDTVSFTTTGNGLLASYYNNTTLNNVYHTVSRVDTNVHISFAGTALTDTTKFSASFSGYVQPQYSENYIFYTNANKGVRLWINDTLLLIDHRNAASPAEYSDTIALKAGLRYPIRMEVFQNGGSAAASLSWKSNSQPKTQVPSARLFPATAPDHSNGYDLLENLVSHRMLEHDMYGWSRDSVADEYKDQYTQWWKIQTNVKGYSRTHPDLYLHYIQKDVDTNTVSRDLGIVSNTIGSWTIQGKINYEKNVPNEDTLNRGPNGTGGSFMEVLDDQNKVLARFYWNMFLGTKVTKLYINNKSIVSAPDIDLQQVYAKTQPITISMAGDSVSCQYGPYATVKTPKFDAAAQWNKPKTLRFYFWTKSRSSLRIIDLESMKFSTTGPALLANTFSQAAPIADTVSQPSFQVYPNPVHGGTFYIRLLQKDLTALQVTLTDLSGKRILNQRLNATTDGYYPITLNKKLPPGIYIVTINNRYTQKMMVY